MVNILNKGSQSFWLTILTGLLVNVSQVHGLRLGEANLSQTKAEINNNSSNILQILKAIQGVNVERRDPGRNVIRTSSSRTASSGGVINQRTSSPQGTSGISGGPTSSPPVPDRQSKPQTPLVPTRQSNPQAPQPASSRPAVPQRSQNGPINKPISKVREQVNKIKEMKNQAQTRFQEIKKKYEQAQTYVQDAQSRFQKMQEKYEEKKQAFEEYQAKINEILESSYVQEAQNYLFNIFDSKNVPSDDEIENIHATELAEEETTNNDQILSTSGDDNEDTTKDTPSFVAPQPTSYHRRVTPTLQISTHQSLSNNDVKFRAIDGNDPRCPIIERKALDLMGSANSIFPGKEPALKPLWPLLRYIQKSDNITQLSWMKVSTDTTIDNAIRVPLHSITFLKAEFSREHKSQIGFVEKVDNQGACVTFLDIGSYKVIMAPVSIHNIDTVIYQP